MQTNEDLNDDDMELIEESSAESYEMHSPLLSKGFALDHAPTVQQALDGAVPFASQSQGWDSMLL